MYKRVNVFKIYTVWIYLYIINIHSTLYIYIYIYVCKQFFLFWMRLIVWQHVIMIYICMYMYVKVKWRVAKYVDPYSEFVLCIQPIHSAHTQQWTHTHREHTPGAVGSHLCCVARGAVGGLVPCSRAPQSWYWMWRECCTFTPSTYNSCRPKTRTHDLWVTRTL